ncbi:Arm DNA-binding domain-containing protein [Hoeflea sp. CAU 1731]
MARTTNKLSAVEVKNINKKGRYSDGGGLYLRVSPTLSKSWVFRWVRNGTENEMGLGPYPTVSLATARDAAFEARRHLTAKRNPKTERDRDRETGRTSGDVADEFLVAKYGNWSNEKTRWQWQHTLTQFSKSIRCVPVSEIDTAHVLKLLKPVWTSKPETAAKARMRLEAVLDYAAAHGWRSIENPPCSTGQIQHNPTGQKCPLNTYIRTT